MTDSLGLATTCGGTGWLDCFCGGDLCACTLRGGTFCYGCEDCEGGDDEDDYGVDWDDEIHNLDPNNRSDTCVAMSLDEFQEDFLDSTK